MKKASASDRATNSSTQKRGHRTLRYRELLGKYRIKRLLGNGGFAEVYEAFDTVEGIPVAVKMPHAHYVSEETLEDFRREAQLVARLDHANILPVKDANFIDNRFVITFRLGQESLSDRLTRRLGLAKSLHYTDQLLAAAAYAHSLKVVHCDIKPENIILFPGDVLRLTDFGISKVARRTIRSAGTGTVGYIAPEQAMGRPSMRSDVFSIGLIVYRMLTGKWPEWPFTWPPQGVQRLRRYASPELIEFIRRAIDPRPEKRFRDAIQMREVFRRIKPRALKHAARRR